MCVIISLGFGCPPQKPGGPPGFRSSHTFWVPRQLCTPLSQDARGSAWEGGGVSWSDAEVVCVKEGCDTPLPTAVRSQSLFQQARSHDQHSSVSRCLGDEVTWLSQPVSGCRGDSYSMYMSPVSSCLGDSEWSHWWIICIW